ncbi:tyrosine phosphatase [Trypanosoma cruzi]|nr:tyrosine phosphatase [Trypanosoma cruzi]
MGLCCIAARRAVSLKKRRIKCKNAPGGTVDLDLVQIHRRIICMGFPALGIESFYRNRYKDVLRYLDHMYGTDYMVYNLCAEPKYRYDLTFFHGRVREFPFPDHWACPLIMIPRFVEDAVRYITSVDHAREAVVVVHCKAGKGRTGLLTCCLLMEIEPSIGGLAKNAISYYGIQRTFDGRGLTLPSQLRYVEYYERLRNEYGGEVPAKVPVVDIHQFHIRGIQAKVTITSCKWCACERVCVISLNASRCFNAQVIKSSPHFTTVNVANNDFFKKLSQDIRVEFLNGCSIVGVLTFHTLFIEREYVYRGLDKICVLKLPESAGISFDFTASLEK